MNSNMSLAEKLLKKIQIEGTVTYGALCQYTIELGYKISTMDRRLREHAEDGLIHPVFATSKRNTRYISAYTAEPAKTPPRQSVTIEVIDGRPVAVIHSPPS